MGRLATVGRVIEQTLRRFRFAPVDKDWPAGAPDHQMYLRPDYSICCAFHDAMAESQLRQQARVAVRQREV